MATSNSISSSRRKLALSIGNNNYSRSESRLRHCVNDASDLSNLLKIAGFDVNTNHNLTNAKMISTLNSFSKSINDGDLVLFYFSGHGYQVNSKNYLMPIDDAQIETEDDVEDYAVSVERTIDRFAAKNPSYVTIFILDCCRKYWPKNTPKIKATTEGKGLHVVDSPAGTFIQYACAADRTASDGLETERNGLFTKHLLKHITNPNEDIVQLFQGIAADVYIESGGKQKPLSINGLMRRGHIYLNETFAVDSDVETKRKSTTTVASIQPKTTTVKDSASSKITGRTMNESTKFNTEPDDYDFIEDFADVTRLAINVVRQKYGAPPVELSEQLSSIAQRWADKLAETGKLEHSPPEWRNFGRQTLGENYMAQFQFELTADKMVRQWLKEGRRYQFGSNGTKDTENFTQLVWQGTQEIGVGRAQSSDGNWWYGVVVFDPPGNIPNQYTNNVMFPQA